MVSTTTPVFTIRPADLADCEQLLAFRAAMFRDLEITDAAQVTASLAQFTGWLQAQFAQPERMLAVIGAVDGTPAACAIAFIYDWYPGASDMTTQRGYVLNVYTDPAWRRRGYAAQLVQACLQWFHTCGISTVSLHASGQGQSVYAKLGFQVTQRMPEMVVKITDKAPGTDHS